MGYAYAQSLAESDVSLDIAVLAHLRNNCYPPVPAIMVAPAVAAIRAYWDDDEGVEVDLPEGVTYRDGSTSVIAYLIIESLHLEAFCS